MLTAVNVTDIKTEDNFVVLSCDSLVDNMPLMDVVKPASMDETSVETVVEMDMLESPLVLDAAVEDEVEKIVKCLEEVARVLANPDSVIVRSKVF